MRIILDLGGRALVVLRLGCPRSMFSVAWEHVSEARLSITLLIWDYAGSSLAREHVGVAREHARMDQEFIRVAREHDALPAISGIVQESWLPRSIRVVPRRFILWVINCGLLHEM